MVEGTDLSKSLQRAGDGVEGILTFLDDNTMIAIATSKKFKAEFAASFWNTGESSRKLF